MTVVDVDNDEDLQNASRQFNDDDFSNGEFGDYRNDDYWIDDNDDIDSYIDDIDSDDYSEDGINQFLDPVKDFEKPNKPKKETSQAHDEPLPKEAMSDDDMRIESYSIASNISKLMKDVTSEDVTHISDKVTDFVRNFKVGSVSSKNNSTTYKDLRTK